jgi:hypothetical protein
MTANRKQPTANRTWIIQRCTQRWIGSELQYEDYPTPDGLMTRDEMIDVLLRVDEQNPNDEFRGHNTAPRKAVAK